MKTIYSTGAFGEPCKIEVNDELLLEVTYAQKILRELPWNGELFLPVILISLNVDKKRSAEIVVGKRIVSVCIEGPEGREPMLDDLDDLLEIPDIYVSRGFDSDLVDNMFSLTLRDIDMIATWRTIRRKNRRNIQNILGSRVV